MSETQVWEHVLKWGIAQNPELPSDPTTFSKENFNSLKNTLNQCIPFIKFFKFTSKEFSEKVLPYKKALPKELYKDLLKIFLNSDYRPPEPQLTNKISINSEIITFQHAELISKWIDRLEVTDELKNSYEFKLIFRGSRDGFTAEEFHRICDNESRTVTVIKVKDSNEILGGFNPIKWNSVGGYYFTKDSFIFSFKNKDNVEDYILSRVNNEDFAVLNSCLYGPSFGADLVTCAEPVGKKNYCSKQAYEKLIRGTTDEFLVEEYEIFQIIEPDDKKMK